VGTPVFCAIASRLSPGLTVYRRRVVVRGRPFCVTDAGRPLVPLEPEPPPSELATTTISAIANTTRAMGAR